MARLSLIGMFLFVATAEAGRFKGMGGGESLKARVPLAPEVRIPGKTLALDVQDAFPQRGNESFPSMSSALRGALEQVFRNPHTVVAANGDALLRVGITQYQPPRSNLFRNVQDRGVPVVRGGAVVVDAVTGQPILQVRRVQVEQWIGRGMLGVRAELVDGASGVLLDSFTASANFDKRVDVSLNGVDQVDRRQIPDQNQIAGGMINEIAAQFARHYNPGAEEVEIPLSISDELKPGNKLAKSGEFGAAVQSWQATIPRKLDTMGDKAHNIGTVYEVQGYDMLLQRQDPARVDDYLQKALAQYEEGLKQDPKEKYMQQAVDRARRGQSVVARLRNLDEARAAALSAGAQASPWPPHVGFGQVARPPSKKYAVSETADAASKEALSLALTDTRADSEKEAQFRQLVKARVQALTARPAPALTQELETLGPQAYALTALESRRVVHQEAQAWNGDASKLKTYRDTFLALRQDGISAEEREILKTLARNLGLTAAQAAAAEASVQF